MGSIITGSLTVVDCQNCGKEMRLPKGTYFGIICSECAQRNNSLMGVPGCPVDHKACSYYNSKICTHDESCIAHLKED